MEKRGNGSQPTFDLEVFRVPCPRSPFRGRTRVLGSQNQALLSAQMTWRFPQANGLASLALVSANQRQALIETGAKPFLLVTSSAAEGSQFGRGRSVPFSFLGTRNHTVCVGWRPRVHARGEQGDNSELKRKHEGSTHKLSFTERSNPKICTLHVSSTVIRDQMHSIW